jgi:hypothetical protein
VDINQNRMTQLCHVIARMVVEPRFKLVISQGREKNLQMLNNITQSAFLQHECQAGMEVGDSSKAVIIRFLLTRREQVRVNLRQIG